MPAAVQLLREHDRWLGEVAGTLRTRPEGAPEAVREREAERKRLEKALRSGGGSGSGKGFDVDALARKAEALAGAQVLTAAVPVPDAKALLEVARPPQAASCPMRRSCWAPLWTGACISSRASPPRSWRAA